MTSRLSRVAAFGAACALLVVGCGGGGGESTTTSTSTAAPSSTATTTTVVPGTVKAGLAPWRLPSPVAREVVLSDGRVLAVVGGFDASKQSTPAVERIDPGTGAAGRGTSLAQAVHDAAGARHGDAFLVFGGGVTENGTADVQSVPASGATTVVGHLPGPRSDHVAAVVGDKIYVLGGFDGTRIVPDVLATSDGTSFSTIGSLPQPVRYPAVAVVGQAVYLFGGVANAQGGDTAAVQRLDTATGAIDLVAQLPTRLSHASAVVLGDQLLLLGGYVDNDQLSDQILRFDPSTGKATLAGRLPAPISDAAAIAIGDTAYLVGGQGVDRAPIATVTTITLG